MTETAADDVETQVAVNMPFPGTPRQYRRIAIGGSIAFHAYLFGGYWAIKHFLAGEDWPQNWVPFAVTVASAALFARMAYRWIMRLDARYGRGSGWLLQPMQVKLPFEKPRNK